MLELSRLQNAQFHIEMEMINLADVILDSMRAMSRIAEEKGIAIRVDKLQPFAVLGDYGRLRQLMIILLDNAVKFSPEGETVHIAVKKRADTCEVSVIDHGCGMDDEALKRIFDRYFYSRSGSNPSGTGLGLPIAREIAYRHGSELLCSSRPGEGTCFTLAFDEHKMKAE